MARFSFNKSYHVGSGIDFFRKVLAGQPPKKINNAWAASGPLKEELDLWVIPLREKLFEQEPEELAIEIHRHCGLLECLACGHNKRNLIRNYCDGDKNKFKGMISLYQEILDVVYKCAEESIYSEPE